MNLLFGVDQDYHHPQKTPGAYEWWHFDATDEKNGISITIQFHAGNLFSPYYQDHLKTYWEKSKSPLADTLSQINPKINTPALPKGPNPLDYCGVSIRIFHQGRMICESYQEFPGKSLRASDKQGAVLLGPHRFNWDAQGDPPSYALTLQAPSGKNLLRIRLFFTPLFNLSAALPERKMPSTHTWILAAPICHVEGTLQWVDVQGESKKEELFLGKGYHDHHFGSMPLDRFVKAWYWGHSYLGEKTLVYSLQVPMDKKDPLEGNGFVIEKGALEMINSGFKLSKPRRNIFWLPYHQKLDLTGEGSLKINHQFILSDGPATLVFEDQVQWMEKGFALSGRGLSTFLYTPRLSSRFFFPMLKAKSLLIKPSQPEEVGPPSGDVSITRP